MKKYNIIYADPPWEYKESGSGNRVVKSKYPTMNIEDIKNMPIQSIAGDNAILFLWVTFPRLQEGLDVISSWGFKYKSLGFNWIKKNKKSNSNFWGMGYYTRQNPEICLIGVKGKMKPLVRNVHSVIETPIEEHSKKPHVIREKIIDIVGDLPRIELFARQESDGWDIWGNELKNDIEL
jgi:N6-adenosine-specific RNA methylase IME4